MKDHAKMIEEMIEGIEDNYTGKRIKSWDVLMALGAPADADRKYLILTGKIFKKRGWKQCRETTRGKDIKNRKTAWMFNVLPAKEGFWY